MQLEDISPVESSTNVEEVLNTCMRLLAMCCAVVAIACGARPVTDGGVPTDSILLSDPCVLADEATQTYYMTGTGGQLWTSHDLQTWQGPMPLADLDPDAWWGRDPEIWAAELHCYRGEYYYFATFTNEAVPIDTVRGNVIPRRACHVLRSERPDGPYRPFGDACYLAPDRPTLDGTLWIDADSLPYMVYCGEWLQNWNGTVEAIRLKADLSGTEGEPFLLFRASDSPWSLENEVDERGDMPYRADGTLPNKVTDGPYLFRTGSGRLGMLWSSWCEGAYTQGVAYSESGTLAGTWVHEPQPITPPNYGHGMIFRAFDGRLWLSCHSHQVVNGRFVRRPHFFEVDLSGDKLVVKDTERE